MSKLTAHQWDWLDSKTTKTKKTIKLMLISLFGSIVLPVFIGFFVVAYNPGDFLPPEVELHKLQNLIFFVFILYFLFIVLGTLIVWASVFAIAWDDSKKDEMSFTSFTTIVKFTAWIKKETWLVRLSRYKTYAISAFFVCVLATQGWFWWSFFFFLFYGLIIGGSMILKHALINIISRLSPAKILELEGNVQGFILEEIINSLKEKHNFVVEKSVENRDDNTPLVTIMITSDAPQSKIRLVCDEDSIAITEVHYNNHIEHCKLPLSLPHCTEEIEHQVVKLITKRIQEANE